MHSTGLSASCPTCPSYLCLPLPTCINPKCDCSFLLLEVLLCVVSSFEDVVVVLPPRAETTDTPRSRHSQNETCGSHRLLLKIDIRIINTTLKIKCREETFICNFAMFRLSLGDLGENARSLKKTSWYLDLGGAKSIGYFIESILL